MRVLVTGGAGFVGRFLVRRLLATGHDVVVLDNLSTGDAASLPTGVALMRGDVTEPVTVLRAIRGVDAVVHLAALLVVEESFAQPDAYNRVNVHGTEVVLDAMRLAGCCNIVFSSTAAVYGNAGAAPLTEDLPVNASSPYGATKAAADRLLGAAAAEDPSFQATSLRFFNVAGAGQGMGEDRRAETHLIPIAVDVALGRRGALHVYGLDHPTRDGTAIRDYVHVNDIVDAHLVALDAEQSGHHIYNVGSEAGHSVLEVVAAIEQVAGVALPYDPMPARAGDPAVLVASSQRLQRELGWKPRSSDLHRIVADTVAFRRSLTG